jgi:hypothetical protein
METSSHRSGREKRVLIDNSFFYPSVRIQLGEQKGFHQLLLDAGLHHLD